MWNISLFIIYLVTVATNLLSTQAVSMNNSSISPELPSSLQTALVYERSSWANGSIKEDTFYTLPGGTANFSAGTLIKVQEDANSSEYTLPPNTAISRFIYQSKDINGRLVPVSAYVLWPLSPRNQSDGFQVAAWAHGTIGLSAECAPSHFRNLWQHFLAPYQLVLQGYVVVATDYAGLGVGMDDLGQPIVHQYLANSAAANDVIYSIQAARQAFTQLSQDFVVIGHSQGGGAAWSVAQKHATSNIPGYLGAVAISPVTNALGISDPVGTLIGAAMATGIGSAFPEFKLEDIVLPEGLSALQQIYALGACSAVGNSLLLGAFMTGGLLQPDWRSNPWVMKYNSITSNGGQRIGGPLLVIHGENDPLLDFSLSVNAVNATVSLFPSSQLEFIRLPNTTHVPALTGSQWMWMDWISDRFAGLEVEPFHNSSVTTPVLARPASAYVPELNWYIGFATESYETP